MIRKHLTSVDAHTTLGLLLTFVIKGNAPFLGEVSAKKDEIIFLTQIYKRLELKTLL